MDLLCRSAVVGSLPLLELVGELDLASIPQFRDAILRLISDHVGLIVAIDLDGVTVLDDAGLGVLLGAAGRARNHGGDVVLVCTEARLLGRFERSGLTRAIEVRSRLAP